MNNLKSAMIAICAATMWIPQVQAQNHKPSPSAPPPRSEPAPRREIPAPAPQRSEPAPRREIPAPAPRRSEPAPRREIPAPAPQRSEPAPRREIPAPAPQRSEPAPRREIPAPAPQRSEPAPRREIPAPAPQRSEPSTRNNPGNNNRTIPGTTTRTTTRVVVTIPTANPVHTEIKNYRRNDREVAVYTNRNTGRKVLQEDYSRDRSQVTRTYYSRTTYERKETVRSFTYRREEYRGREIYTYRPYYIGTQARYYDPFCSYHEYRRDWNYAWGFEVNPWYRHYGYYYRPYTVYVYPSQWLVDYTLSTVLSDDYQQRSDDGIVMNDPDPSSDSSSNQQAQVDELKTQIQAQVDSELSARKDGGTQSLDTKLLDKNRIYMVSGSLELNLASDADRTCKLGAGDLLSLADEGVSDDGASATMLVQTSKAGDCEAGTQVIVSIVQLQEFENEFNRRLDLGMEKMKTDSTVSSILQGDKSVLESAPAIGSDAVDTRDDADTSDDAGDDSSDDLRLR